MKKKPTIVAGAFRAILAAVVLQIVFFVTPGTAVAAPLPPTAADEARYLAKVDGRDFAVFAEGRWQKKFLKGVNMGVAKPGAFPGEHAITKAEYLRWFQNISDMNADVIRVYTTQNPDFYDGRL